MPASWSTALQPTALTGRSGGGDPSPVGGPNQVVSASRSPGSAGSPTQATYPSGRTSTAGGAVTAPSAGSSHAPPYSASTRRTRSTHGATSKARGSPRL